MKKAELKKALIDKLFEEMKEYKEELLKEEPKDILNGAYRFYFYQDFVYAMHDYKFTNEEMKKLLTVDYLLSVFYDFWLDFEDHNHEDLHSLVDVKKDTVIGYFAKGEEKLNDD